MTSPSNTHNGRSFGSESNGDIVLGPDLILPGGEILRGGAAGEDAGALRVIRRWERAGGPWLRCRTTVVNTSAEAVPVGDIRIVAGATLRGALLSRPKVFSQSNTMTGVIAIAAHPSEGRVSSDACMGWTDGEGTSAMVAGLENPGEAFYTLRSTARGDDIELECVCHRDGASLPGGAGLELSPLLIGVGESLSSLMDEYAVLVSRRMSARVPRPGRPTTGWCSWYYYYGTESEGDVLDNARSLRPLFPADATAPAAVIQIDDGWNLPRNGHARVWGDWRPGEKFPRGMRAVVRDIHAQGFRAGLWLAPFSVDRASRLAAEHPEWIVRARNPETGLLDPAGPGHVFGLDLSHPEVLAWLRETFDRVFSEWGFDYVKIDFLMHGALSGVRHDPTTTPAEAFRRGLEVIRGAADAAGPDRFILCCGSPMGPAIGLTDGMRIGYDVGSRWYLPMTMPDWPNGNCCIKSAAYPVLFRQWMHGRFWESDPDCLVVRDHCSAPEFATFAKSRFVAGAVAESDFGLDAEEAAFWARLIWMTGGMAILSEVVDELPEERLRMLKKALVPHGLPVRWVDCYGDPEICVLQSMSGAAILGVFNLSDSPRQISLPRRVLRRWPAVYREWLDGRRLTAEEGSSHLHPPVLPPHGACVWTEDFIELG